MYLEALILTVRVPTYIHITNICKNILISQFRFTKDNMAIPLFLCGFLVVLALLEPSLVKGGDGSSKYCGPIEASDKDLIQVALNLEFLETEFFLYGALGKGLDSINPSLANGGPPPIGARKADLDPLVHRIIEEFGYQEVGHLRFVFFA